jgi:hypothetical protein
VAEQLVILEPDDTPVGIPAQVILQAQSLSGDVATGFAGSVTLVAGGSASGAGRLELTGGEGWLLIRDSIAEVVELSLADSEATGLDVSSRANVEFLAGATEIFRSVGPGNSAPLESGAGNSLAIAASVAHLTGDLPNHAGVGDALQYDSNDDGSLDALAFVHRRYGSRDLCLRTAAGAAPPETDATEHWQLNRAYTSVLAAVLDGDENAGIDAVLRDFDTWSQGHDAAAANEVWHVALYADAAETPPTEIDVGRGWTTSATSYLRLFVPARRIDVGVSQRHPGRWDDSAATLEANGNNGIQIRGAHVHIEGLQIRMTPGTPYHSGVYPESLPDGSVIQISHNIVRMDGAEDENYGIEIIDRVNDSAPTARIWNNVIQGFAGAGYGIHIAQGTAYLYSNTVVDCFRCIRAAPGAIVVAKNNIVQAVASGTAFNGSFATGSDYNLANDSTSTGGAGDQLGVTLTFADAAGGDYHLAGSDSPAIDTGHSLAGDSQLAFDDDIDGEPRLGGWCIGADEH